MKAACAWYLASTTLHEISRAAEALLEALSMTMAILYYGAWLYLRVSVDLTAEGSAATLALAPAPVRR